MTGPETPFRSAPELGAARPGALRREGRRAVGRRVVCSERATRPSPGCRTRRAAARRDAPMEFPTSKRSLS